MNYKFCCRYPQHAGNTKFADHTGNTQLKHDTLIKHNASLKHKTCHDLCNESATPLPVAFRRQKAANQCAEEAELIGVIFSRHTSYVSTTCSVIVSTA